MSKKTKDYFLQRYKQLAITKKGKCLSSKYGNAKTKLKWKCKKGHVWETLPSIIEGGSWCPTCAKVKRGLKRRKYTIENAKELALSKKGKCLSKEMGTSRDILEWQCFNSHKWKSTYQNILGTKKRIGTWCPECAKVNRAKNRRRYTIQDLKELAKKKGGTCISRDFSNIKEKTKWKCTKGHIWEASFQEIRGNNSRRGTWCPSCANKTRGDSQRESIQDMKKLATERNWKLVSTNYVNNSAKLKWLCNFEHSFLKSPNAIRNGGGCNVCAKIEGKTKERVTIRKMKKIAKEKGGKCLSEKIKNSRTILKFQCSEGHIWETGAINVISGSWCHECSSGLYERICRAYFESIFKNKFPKKYPDWLKTKDGAKLELDGYCEELGIAFEHHGLQNYTLDTHFISKRSDLEKRKMLDQYKERLCKENNVKLFIIPSLQYITKLEDLKSLIKKVSKQLRVSLPRNFENIVIDITKANKPGKLKELQKIAKLRKGKILSKTYLGAQKKHQWQCKNGHEWHAVPDSIKRGSWCKECYDANRGVTRRDNVFNNHYNNFLEFGIEISKNKDYKGTKSKIEFRCICGHIWKSSIVDSSKKDKKCPIC